MSRYSMAIDKAVSSTGLQGRKRLPLFCSILLGACCAPTFADNWESMTGANKLHEFVAGAIAEITLVPGVTAVGKYNADGTAQIKAWNETFQRSWAVKGNDQVCYSSDEETNCFRFEKNLDEPGAYRSQNLKTGEWVVFRIMEGEEGEEETFSGKAPAEEDAGGLGSPSAAEIAAALSDPNTNLGSMNFQFDYVAYQGDIPGAGGAEAQRMLFQPSLPYKLSETTNVFMRPAVPVIFNQDVPDRTGGFDSEGVDLGDISFDAALAKSLPGGFVVLGGLAGTLPTATDDSLGLDQWLLGPEAALAMVRSWGVMGVLVSHQWDVAGEDDYDTSVTGGQYFYALNMGNGWQINGSPTFSYNHEAPGDDNWTFPLAIGFSKTVILSGRPWKFGVQYWHYLETPDTFGPDYQVRFSVSPVVKLPW